MKYSLVRFFSKPQDIVGYCVPVLCLMFYYNTSFLNTSDCSVTFQGCALFFNNGPPLASNRSKSMRDKSNIKNKDPIEQRPDVSLTMQKTRRHKKNISADFKSIKNNNVML